MEAAPPRPSTSSSRSLRRTHADFEAALRNPQETLYLSAGPPPIGEDLESEAASTATGHHHSSSTSTAAIDDPDTPLPVEKRSFEDDLRALDRAREREEGRIGLGVGHVREGSVVKKPPIPVPGVIPPTPKGHARKASCVTTTSTTSTGTGDTPTRARRQVKSVGLDGGFCWSPLSWPHALTEYPSRAWDRAQKQKSSSETARSLQQGEHGLPARPGVHGPALNPSQ